LLVPCELQFRELENLKMKQKEYELGKHKLKVEIACRNIQKYWKFSFIVQDYYAQCPEIHSGI
jgi:hypothetical protein